MSTLGGGSQRRPTLLIYAVAIIIAGLVGGVAYFALVVRERRIAENYVTAAGKIEKELVSGRDFLRRHQNDVVTRKLVDETAADVKRKIPYGPVDLTVGSYIDSAATQAGIQDEKWSVEGGIKVPRPLNEDKRTNQQRLTIDPGKLHLSNINVQFSARYRETLALLKLLADAPWPIEIVTLDMHRDPAGPKVFVNLVVRYVFE
jgi:hypothetical protein